MDDVRTFTSDSPFHQPGAFAGNRFAGKTDELPRPDRQDPEFGHVPAWKLAELQQQWDFADGARIAREAAFAEATAKQAADAAAKHRPRKNIRETGGAHR